jgi:hypothetical protein
MGGCDGQHSLLQQKRGTFLTDRKYLEGLLMGYYDPPEDQGFTGCPLCKHDEWVVQDGEQVCGNCGVKYTYAMDHFDVLFDAIPSVDYSHEAYEIDDEVWQPLSPEEQKLLEIAEEESYTTRLKELGYLDERGEPTDAYYRESDRQYDCLRESGGKF